MKLNYLLLFITILHITLRANATYTSADDFPFAPAAGQPGSTAIAMNDVSIVAWATGYQQVNYGTNVDALWQTPELALGPATGSAFDTVSLGRGGSITLTFNRPIINGSGADFCIFENGFGANFIELAYVEVSTDGVHYVRFPNFSFTANSVGSFGTVNPTFVFGYASKYQQGYGTPFDLEQLQLAYDAALLNQTDFSSSFATDLEDNFPLLNLNDIRYVRLVDVVGDGSARDADGFVIYDPYPTSGSAGLDLEAVGVIHELPATGLTQAIDFPAIANQKISNSLVGLTATASSGLPVSYQILSGPAQLQGNNVVFTGKGTIAVSASQFGNTTYAAAAPVVRSFVVADEVQHIYLNPIAHQLVGATQVPLTALAASGLAVELQVIAGPSGVTISAPPGNLLTAGNETGSVAVRALQIGNATYAPAASVETTFKILNPGDPHAPQTFAQFALAQGLSGVATADWDADGNSDLQEFIMGTNAKDSFDRTQLTPAAATNGYGEPVIELQFTASQEAVGATLLFEYSTDGSNWNAVQPEMIDLQFATVNGVDIVAYEVALPWNSPGDRYRMQLTSGSLSETLTFNAPQVIPAVSTLGILCLFIAMLCVVQVRRKMQSSHPMIP